MQSIFTDRCTLLHRKAEHNVSAKYLYTESLGIHCIIYLYIRETFLGNRRVLDVINCVEVLNMNRFVYLLADA